jgi:hypothetical protein
MAYSKEQLERIFSDLAARINISDALFKVADEEYTALGKWINNETEKNGTKYKVLIYPQGSFALGTVIKPISDEDDYDLDLVCLVENGMNFSAKQLKLDVVKPWLIGYKKTKNDIEEKRRCWHLEYEDVPHFHMDVIPAIPSPFPNSDSTISITDKNVDRSPVYEYQESNPKGYVQWFFQRCRQKKMGSSGLEVMSEMAQQEDLKRNKNKTQLQKAVQILKRHRDVMFKDDPDNKPISIIITTLAGQIYHGETTILDTLLGFVGEVEHYLKSHCKEDGSYSIPNPSYNGEDFADKWKDHPERQTAFFSWIKQLQSDFNLENLMNQDRVAMGNIVKEAFGSTTGKAIFSQMGYEEANEVKDGIRKVDTVTGNLSKTGIVAISPSRHYGEIQ